MKTGRITQLGLLLAVSLVLAYLESLLPVMVAVPGVKLGLANIVTMFVLERMGFPVAFLFMSLRVFLAGILFSGPAGMIYSFAGGCCCVLVMSLVKRCPFFSLLGISMIGAVFHNVGQILVAWFVMDNAGILYYFPVLCLSGILTGLVVGFLSSLLLSQMNRIFP